MFKRYESWLLLVSRVILGGIFIAAGWMKASDMASTIGYFNQMGLHAVIAYIVSYAEILGGAALAIGLWSDLAALGLSIIIIGATYFGYKAAPMMQIPVFQAIMPTLGLLAGLLALAASGAGKYGIRTKKN